MDEELKALREEVARLRERAAVLEASLRAPVPRIDWTQPVHIGSPHFVTGSIPPGAVTC